MSKLSEYSFHVSKSKCDLFKYDFEVFYITNDEKVNNDYILLLENLFKKYPINTMESLLFGGEGDEHELGMFHLKKPSNSFINLYDILCNMDSFFISINPTVLQKYRDIIINSLGKSSCLAIKVNDNFYYIISDFYPQIKQNNNYNIGYLDSHTMFDMIVSYYIVYDQKELKKLKLKGFDTEEYIMINYFDYENVEQEARKDLEIDLKGYDVKNSMYLITQYINIDKFMKDYIEAMLFVD